MTFPSDSISELLASLLVVCVFAFAKSIAFIAKFLDPAFITTQAYSGDNR